MTSPSQAPAELAEENLLLRLYLVSAIAHLLDLTDCVEYRQGEDPDAVETIPLCHLEDARNAARGMAKAAGIALD